MALLLLITVPAASLVFAWWKRNRHPDHDGPFVGELSRPFLVC
jgi:hypothetical protein